jgi:nicotinamide-nucleotide amidase
VSNPGESPDEEAAEAAQALIDLLASRVLHLACAESCTGGIIAGLITEIPGASDVLWGGVVAYSNECKERLLGVSPETLARFGAVSRETARSMAEGMLAASNAELSLAVTGIAGPGGGSVEKPVGLVWFAWASSDGRCFETSERFAGDRREVRIKAAKRALTGAAQFVAAGMKAVGSPGHQEPGRGDRY